jgi:hypothetical protein
MGAAAGMTRAGMMALYRKKTLTEASLYTAGMEDGWTLLWSGGLFTHELRTTREAAQAHFNSMFRNPEVQHTGEAEPSVVPVILTLEGWHAISDGDWIATGPKGERYPIKPDIFAATYELAESV